MPYNTSEREAIKLIDEKRKRVISLATAMMSRSDKDVQLYNNAYDALVKRGDPAEFREFLLSANDLFLRLGEQLGIAQHVVSFWQYRFPKGKPRLIEAIDLLDVFADFEIGLAGC